MRIYGFTIPGTKSADDVAHLSEVDGGWWPVVREGFAGAWQNNVTIKRDTLIAFTAVYACVNRISQDIGKMPICLKMKNDSTGIWSPIDRNNPNLPVLRRPNGYQSRSQFLQQWMISKLLAGNTYILKVRDKRQVVVKMYPLDPTRVRPLVSPDGSIFYQIAQDSLSEVYSAGVVVPQSEIIHDRMPALFHPLIGTSPIFACGLAAAQGHHIQKMSAAFFKNQGVPGGILSAPGKIGDDTAKRLKTAWDEGFGGRNSGRVAVLGDGLKFDKLTISSSDAQLIEQLKWSGETVCSAFGVPPFMVGILPPPTYTNIEAMAQQYLSLCLQTHIEDIECNLDEGLGLETANTPDEIGVELDTEVLLRMDTSTRFKTWKDGISAGFMTPNEARAKENLTPAQGGDTPYLQQQQFSLAALDARDRAGPAPASTAPTGASAPSGSASATEPKPQPGDPGYTEESYLAEVTKHFIGEAA